MDKVRRISARTARDKLSELLDAAEKGEAMIVTRHGKPVAALIPIAAYTHGSRQEPLLPVAGTGRGLWRNDSTAETRRFREEWTR